MEENELIPVDNNNAVAVSYTHLKKIIVIITESSNATYILSSLQNTFLLNGVIT